MAIYLFTRIHARPSLRRKKLRVRFTCIRRSSVNKRGAAALACMDSDGSEDVDQLQSGGHLTLVYE